MLCACVSSTSDWRRLLDLFCRFIFVNVDAVESEWSSRIPGGRRWDRERRWLAAATAATSADKESGAHTRRRWRPRGNAAPASGCPPPRRKSYALLVDSAAAPVTSATCPACVHKPGPD